MSDPLSRRHPLYPNARRSPYFARTEAAGATEYMVYNHMYMPMAYGRDRREDYDAVTSAVALWDVGPERQTELRGPGARALADLLTTRRLSDLEVGRCRYTVCCDDAGQIICDPVLLLPWHDVVWLSHGTVDLTLWAHGYALSAGLEVTVGEPDVAPLQVQGPRSLDVLRPLIGPGLDDLRPFTCTQARIGQADVIVSRTGWSGGLGYEVFPLTTEHALDTWDAIAESGQGHGMLVTGPNVSKAMEAGITDTSYATNQDLNPLELWQDYLVDLDKGPFIGREALRRIAEQGVRRKVVGLLGPSTPLPRLEWPWPIVAGRDPVGSTRWVTWSFALERVISIGVVEIERAAPGAQLMLEYPGGAAEMTVVPLPFVS